MKLLLAYDGSRCADAALLDLQRAGLPAEMEVLVLTVAEIWSPPGSAHARLTGDGVLTPHERQAAALRLAQDTAARLAVRFEDWRVIGVANSGAPSAHIIQTAKDWHADLIVVGSRGCSAVERLAFGSVSLKVLQEAPCSVRIARGNERVNGAQPLRLLIGLDDSACAKAAVALVARRRFPPDTEVRLATAIDAPDWYPGMPFEPVTTHARKMQQEAERELAEAGLVASSVMAQLHAVDLLLEEAERWKADSIFVGTHGRGLASRLLLGSVSSRVTKDARCSVEIVREAVRN